MGHAFEEIGPLYKQTASLQRRDSLSDSDGVESSFTLSDDSRTYEELEITVGGEVADNIDRVVSENGAPSDSDLDLHSDDLDSDSD